ncbi:MAG: hypothetical protein RBR53_06310 [Desulforegulaceae bacterium]|nr:hypothetical protein [Desulforegulaceae bacterium]
MNEFLHKLRTANSNKKHNKPYRNNDGNSIGNHYPERRSNNDRRWRAPKPSGIKEEVITSLKNSIEDTHTTLQDQVLLLERNIDAQERQANALEHIADLFTAFMEKLEALPSPQPAQETAPAEILDESNLIMSAEEAEQIKKTSRTYILNLIQSLRDKNSTYDEVALYLTENDFPTFSGRGKWHAQTIHRLCQEIKKSKTKQ